MDRMDIRTDIEPRLAALVVDDNRDAADSLALLLQIWGHRARVAYDTATALRLAGEEPPDVVLADLGMPRLDGAALARELRRTPGGSHFTLIAVTGHATEEHRSTALAAGFDHFFLKPVEPDELNRLLVDVRRRAAEALACARERLDRAEAVTRRTAALMEQTRRESARLRSRPSDQAGPV
jgi:DNA-binding response OmpR family regulator